MRRSLAVSASSPLSSTRRRLGFGGAQLGLGPSGKRGGAEAVVGVDCLAEQVAGLAALVAAAQEGAQVSERACLFEAGVGAGEHLDRFAQQGLAACSARYEPGGPQRQAQGARGTEGPGQLELFVTEASRRVGFTNSQRGQGSLGTPRQPARADREAAGGDLTGRPKVAECLTEAVLSEQKSAAGVPQYAGRKGHARKVSRQGPERPYGPVKVVAFHQHLDQYARSHQGVQQRRRPTGGVPQGLCIGLGGSEIATPQGEPGSMRQHRRNDHPVGGGLRLDHGSVEKHLGLAVALGAVQRYHRTLEPGRVTWLRQRTRAAAMARRAKSAI